MAARLAQRRQALGAGPDSRLGPQGSGSEPARACLVHWMGTGASSGAAVDLALELHRELGLKPWHPSIFAVGSIGEVDEECNSLDDPYRLKNWLMVRDIRRRLVEET